MVRTLDDGVIINAYNARIFKSAPGRTDANFRGTGNGEHEDDINYANNSKIFFVHGTDKLGSLKCGNIVLVWTCLSHIPLGFANPKLAKSNSLTKYIWATVLYWSLC